MMDPIGYTMIGHPLCLPCFDGDYRRDLDGVAYAHDGQPVADDVTPVHVGDPDDGAPCAGCGLPLAAAPDADITWTCPDCGSTDLRVFYSERRTCRVSTYADGPNAPEPWPSYTGDEMVDIDPALFAFTCDACNTHDITPSPKGDTVPWTVTKPRSAWLVQAREAWAALAPQAPEGSQLRALAAIDHKNVAWLIEALAALTPGDVSQERQDLAGLRPVGEVLGMPDRSDVDDGGDAGDW